MSGWWWIVFVAVSLMVIVLVQLAIGALRRRDVASAFVGLVIAATCVWSMAWRYNEETRPETFKECVSKYSYEELAFDNYKNLKECVR